MKVVYDIVIDFARPSKTNEILVSQGDHLTRVPHFILRANGKELDVSDVSTYTITAVKADGSKEYESGTLDTDDDGNQINEITYEIPQALTDTTGTCTCAIALNGSDGSVLHSFEFYIRNRNELKQEDDSSEDDLAGFRDILDRAEEATEKIEALSNMSKLPNPYPLRGVLGNTQFSYDGSETVTIKLTGVAFLSDKKVKATQISWP